MIRRGDIVLIPYPFTDLKGSKVRPALVISADTFNRSSQDAVFLFITTKRHRSQYDFQLSNKDPEFKSTGLKQSSTFRASKLMCLSQILAKRRLGQATQAIMNSTDAALKLLLDI